MFHNSLILAIYFQTLRISHHPKWTSIFQFQCRIVVSFSSTMQWRMQVCTVDLEYITVLLWFHSFAVDFLFADWEYGTNVAPRDVNLSQQDIEARLNAFNTTNSNISFQWCFMNNISSPSALPWWQPDGPSETFNNGHPSRFSRKSSAHNEELASILIWFSSVSGENRCNVSVISLTLLCLWSVQIFSSRLKDLSREQMFLRKRSTLAANHGMFQLTSCFNLVEAEEHFQWWMD